MSGQRKHPLDDMNEILLRGESFFYNEFEVKLIQQRNYEVFKNGVKIKRLLANWSTYFEIEEILLNGI